MASKKDMRREDLVIPYVSPEKDKDASDMASKLHKSNIQLPLRDMRNSHHGEFKAPWPTLCQWPRSQTPIPKSPEKHEFMSIENLKTFDPFAEADEDIGDTKQSQNYIHIRIQQRNGRKTLTTVQGLPKKFDQKKILKVIKKKFACNGTIVNDTEMGEVIQLQGDQRKDVQEFLVDKKEGLELDAKTIKVHGF
ncbi:translation initiation factor sui1 [Lasallia pustulata]|uniref:Translation initiation factor sui1 n=2 Tax=Lasallia pustulata TaxID=136370 RepID=A0A1W5D5Q1_9LECA|nr:translation initiation factor sui1 [Lasallia pustulata]